MEWYAAVKLTHVAGAALSLMLFVLRGGWTIAGSPRVDARWVRSVPHVNDTLLLAAGVALIFLTRQYPGEAPWLTAKLIALVLYILLGMAALRRGATMTARLGAWCAALAVFLYIVAVALTRNPVPWSA